MQGNELVIRALNELLADELAAMVQYVVHARMCRNWGYKRLAKQTLQRALEEMDHGESLIDRIVFLEGTPEVRFGQGAIGSDVRDQLIHDLDAENRAISNYNAAILLCNQDGVRDATTREMLEEIVGDENDHVEYLEAQLKQIKDIGLDNYLAAQV